MKCNVTYCLVAIRDVVHHGHMSIQVNPKTASKVLRQGMQRRDITQKELATRSGVWSKT